MGTTRLANGANGGSADASPPDSAAGIRKAQLIRAVYRVMSREGVHRVSLQRIAEEAGVSKGLLLYHYDTKDAMVLSAMEWVLESTADRRRHHVANIDDDAQLLSAVLDAIWLDPVKNLEFFRFYLDGVEHQARSPEFDEFAQSCRETMNGLYTDIIQLGVDVGLVTVGDPVAAGIQMRSIIEGTFLQWLQTPDWRESHGHYKDLCRDGLSRILRVDAGHT